MNRQEVLDKVVIHLLTQKKQSRDENSGCKYRSQEGLKCAIGCLIPDEIYSRDLEFHCVDHPDFVDVLDRIFGVGQVVQFDVGFLRHLQRIHDGHSPDVWAVVLKNFATAAGLQFNPPQEPTTPTVTAT